MFAANEILRERLLQRILESDVRIALLQAPAGYGKSTLARQLASSFERVTVVDFAGADSLVAITERFAAMPANRGARDLIVFENAEALGRVVSAEALLNDVLASLPANRLACVCSRVPLDIALSRIAEPHQIVVLTERALAFDRADLAEFAGRSKSDVGVLFALTRGWPLCVRLIARLGEGRNAHELLDELRSVEHASLFGYLVENVIESQSEPARAVTIALAALGAATPDDFHRMFGEGAEEATKIARESPFTIEDGGTYVLHPLLVAAVAERFAAETAGTLREAAILAAEEDAVRAAELFVRARDWDGAAEALESLTLAFVAEPADARVPTLTLAFPNDVLTRHPRLFAYHQSVNLFDGTVSERLAQCVAVDDAIDPTSDAEAHCSSRAVVALALSDAGQHREALKAAEELAATRHQLANYYSQLISARVQARMGRYASAAVFFQPIAHRMPGAAAVVTAIELRARRARAQGSAADEAAACRAAILGARRAGATHVLFYALAEDVFSAWFWHDEERFARAASELESPAFLTMRDAGVLLFRCIAGEFDDLSPGRLPPDVQTHAYLIGMTFARGEVQRTLARHALSSAQRSNQPFVMGIARVAAALVDRDALPRLLSEAMAISGGIDDSPLHDSIAELLEGRVPPFLAGVARALVDADSSQRLAVSALDQRVSRGGSELSATKREMELLAFLAYRDSAVSKDELAEALAPDASSADADGTLRVLVARVRKKFGDDVVVSGRGTYSLGPDVVNPLREMRDRVARWETQQTFSLSDAVRARRDAHAIESFLNGRRPDYEWGEELDRDVEQMLGRVRQVLAARHEAPTSMEMSNHASHPTGEAVGSASVRGIARVRSAWSLWRERGRDDGFLLRGKPLDEARALVADATYFPPELSKFVALSEREARRLGRRTRALVAGAAALAILAIATAIGTVDLVRQTVQTQRVSQLSRFLEENGFAADARHCAKEKEACQAATEAWLNRYIPALSTVTLPRVVYNYGVRDARFINCRLDFTKRYTDRRSGKLVMVDREWGTVTNVANIFIDTRGFDGGSSDLEGRPMQVLPTVIIQSYVPFDRVVNGAHSTYGYTYFTFMNEEVARKVEHNLRLLAALCAATSGMLEAPQS